MANDEDDSLMTRWSLIRRVSSPDCDEETWGQFYETYRRVVYAVARRAGLTHEEAEDATQETMASVCTGLKSFTADGKRGRFRGWLLQNARWRISDLIRKRPPSVRPPVSLIDATQSSTEGGGGVDPASADFDVIWEAQWRAKLLELAGDRLRRRASPAHFQIFQLAVLQDLPVLEVAKTLGIGAGRVYLTKHRMLLQLRKELRDLQHRI